MLNSAFAVQQAGFVGQRVEKEVGSDPAVQIQRVFQLSFQRDPTPQESAAAVKLIGEYGLPALARALLNANEFLYID